MTNELQKYQALTADKSPERLSALASDLTGLFAEPDTPVSYQAWQTISAIYKVVLQHVERDVRRRIAEYLSFRPDAPKDLIIDMMHDEIEIAWPIVANSSVVKDQDLINLFGKRKETHGVAIASRAWLGQMVSSTIIESGHEESIIALLNNDTASIAETAFMSLAQYAKPHPSLHEPLLARNDIPWAAVEAIAGYVSEKLQHFISERWNISKQEIAHIVNRAKQSSLQQAEANFTTEYNSHGQQTLERFDGIVAYVKARQFKKACQLISSHTQLPESVAMTLITNSPPRDLAILCRSVGASKLVLADLLAACSNKAKSNTQQMIDALNSFGEMDSHEAKGYVAAWRLYPELFIQKSH